jgi:formylglycine-generating enzyme required for sulfatase activity
MTFVLVPPGKFLMGSPEREKDRGEDEMLHEVTLTEPFDLGKMEVTQAQYQAVAAENPSHLKKEADRPVEGVNWGEARDWAAKVTKKRADGHLYRLPTEAEREFSCRGGRSSSECFGVGDGRALSSREANFNGNYPYGGADKGPFLFSPCRVGSYAANALGLHDMEGNVMEWCADWYGPYDRDQVTNPSGTPRDRFRVARGGWFSSGGDCCRAACRAVLLPSIGRDISGFRLARTLPSRDN